MRSGSSAQSRAPGRWPVAPAARSTRSRGGRVQSCRCRSRQRSPAADRLAAQLGLDPRPGMLLLRVESSAMSLSARPPSSRSVGRSSTAISAAIDQFASRAWPERPFGPSPHWPVCHPALPLPPRRTVRAGVRVIPADSALFAAIHQRSVRCRVSMRLSDWYRRVTWPARSRSATRSSVTIRPLAAIDPATWRRCP